MWKHSLFAYRFKSPAYSLGTKTRLLDVPATVGALPKNFGYRTFVALAQYD